MTGRFDHEIPDCDIDVKDRDRVASMFREATIASQVTKDKHLVKHNTSLHFQKIPVDPITGLSAFPYKQAEGLGYHKVDLIPNHVYDQIGTEEELLELLDLPVDWDWFQDERFFGTNGLTHLSDYLWLCRKFPPKSLVDIAALIAVYRPQKAHLIKQSKTLDEIKEVVWNPSEGPQDKYFFKKSHSIAFAMLVIVHAQLIARKLDPKTYEPDGDFFI